VSAAVRRPVASALVAALLGWAGAEARAAGEPVAPLEDNSFLLEEAYNQEPHVVQHIFNWVRFEPEGDYVLAFSQEWPLFGQRHQIAYSIPFESLGGPGRGAGFGDFEIQHRYQWLGIDGGRLAAAPEFTLLLPTGDSGEDHGAGATGSEIGHDFENGLQIVPGIAFPIGIGASSGDAGVLLYLSFEHGF